MNVRCYTVRQGQVYSGIDGSVLNIHKDSPVYVTTVNTVRPSDYSGNDEIGNTPWETDYVFTDCSEGAITRGGIVHLSLDEWIPCTDLGDSSVLLEAFEDGTGILFMPRMACILRSNPNGMFLVSGNSGKPEIGLSGATGVLRRTHYRGIEKTPRPVSTPVNPALSALVASLKTYRDNAEPLPLTRELALTNPQNTSV